jgi:hypothetical protein
LWMGSRNRNIRAVSVFALQACDLGAIVSFAGNRFIAP